jgi:hypothetical protein
MVLLPLAIQMPAVQYSSPTTDIPAEILLKYWTMDCEQIRP